jgi:hypothetical protein
MGQKVNQDTLKKYIEQWVGLRSQPHESAADFTQRVYDTGVRTQFPFGAFYTVEERCGFLEAIMLNRKRSLLCSLLDQMEDTVLIGLEQSSAFAGKHSLFCAFRCDDPQHFSEKMKHIAKCTHNKGHVISANVLPTNEVIVAASFATFLSPS